MRSLVERLELIRKVKKIKAEHKPSTFSEYLKEIVYGGNDGIITTFAVVAGFAGAQTSQQLPITMVLLFGFANLFADGLSMGLGNFLSLRSEQDLYKKERRLERKQIRTNRSQEIDETIALLKARGFSNKQAEELTRIYASNEEYWTEFMMKYEMDMQNPFDENPYLTALATFLSFVFFGFIPLMPYVLLPVGDNTFIISAVFTFASLILLGVIRWRLTREPMLRSVGEIVLIGSVAATIAYFVGTFFKF